MTNFLAFLGVAPLFFLSPAARPSDNTGGTAPVEILRTRHLAVKVKINGQGPFRLAFDTGSPLTFISRRTAVKLGLITAEAAKQPTMFGLGGQAVVKSLNINGVEVKNLSVMILDHPIVELIRKVEGSLEGIVGLSFFARFHTSIDYANSRLTFTPVDYEPQDVMASVMARMMRQGGDAEVIAPAGLWGFTVTQLSGEPGIRVEWVFPGGPAEAGGLKAGDRIVTIDGRWTDTVTDCYNAAAAVKAGRSVSVQIYRGNVPLTIQVQPRTGL
jgi:hypothetical protein